MTPTPRIIPLLLAVLLSACINLPEVAEPEMPDAGTPPPDAGVPTDTTAPTITATQPAHGSTNVVANSPLAVTFSEPMSVSTVQYSLAPSQTISGATWSAGNTQLTLQPTAPLALNTNYTLTVEGKDAAGNVLAGRKTFSFTTAGPAPDTTPPAVLGSNPGDTNIGVARNANITVMFSEPMDKPSTEAAFAILSPSSSSTGAFTWNPGGTEMTFDPNTDFPYGTDVAWRVSTAAKDPSGNALPSIVIATFRAIRQTTVTFDSDRDTSSSAVGPNYYASHIATESVGDWNGNTQERLLIGFNLGALPDNLTRITASKLKWYVSGQRGNPFSSLGGLVIERIYIGESIAFSDGPPNPASKTQYESAALGVPIIASGGIAPPMAVFDVAPFTALDWADRTSRNAKRSQVRLRFENATDNDSTSDGFYSDVDPPAKLAELEITYEYP